MLPIAACTFRSGCELCVIANTPAPATRVAYRSWDRRRGVSAHGVGERDAHDGALAAFVDSLSRTPTLDLAARIGDLHQAAGRTADAEHFYQLAEDLAGPAASQNEANLAMFLAEHDRKLPEAVALAEMVARFRHDIGTDHALAWAYFRVGRLRDAAAAMARAERTGSRDERLLAHAAAIRASMAAATGGR